MYVVLSKCRLHHMCACVSACACMCVCRARAAVEDLSRLEMYASGVLKIIFCYVTKSEILGDFNR